MKKFYWIAKRSCGTVEQGFEDIIDECRKYKKDNDIWFYAEENIPLEKQVKILNDEVVQEWLEKFGETIEKGEMWFYQKAFLYGIITNKQFLMDGLQFMPNHVLRIKHFRYVYALFEIAYTSDGVHLSAEGFSKKLSETNKINETWKEAVQDCYDLCLTSRKSLSEEEFRQAIKYLIIQEKYRCYDREVVKSIKKRKDGNIQEADELLLKYLHTFKSIDSINKPVSLASRSKYVMDEYLSSKICNFDTFSERLNVLTGGGWKGETWIIGGYCLKKGTLILNGNGTYIPIEEFVEKKIPYVVSMGFDFKLSRQKVSSWLDTGLLDTFEVKTHTGNIVSTSINHPFFTLDGWKKLKELKVGDYVAIPRKLPMPIKKRLKNYEIKMLAYMLAEGNIKTCSFTNTDEEVISDFKRICYEHFRIKKIRKDKITYFPSGNIDNGENLLREFLKKIGVHGLSKEKEIPKKVFQCGGDTLALFLGSFWNCDGSVGYGDEKRLTIELTLSSELMVKQIRRLLLRFGITGRFKKRRVKLNEKYFNAYVLSILGYDNIFKFYNHIPLMERKKKKIEEYLSKYSEVTPIKSRSNYLNSHPKQLWSYIYKIAKFKNIKIIDLAEMTGNIVYVKVGNAFKRCINFNKNRNIPNNLLRCIGYILDDSYLKNFAEGDIMWDRIESIKYEGRNQCYDLSVPSGNNNFIANDFIVHNTSDGKTNLAKEFAYNAMKFGDNILFVTLEMLKEEMCQIFEARVAYDMGYSDITLEKIRRRKLIPSELEDYKKVAEQLLKYKNLYIHEPIGRFTMDDLEAIIDSMSATVKIDIVIVDYLELIDPDKDYESYRIQVKQIMRRAKKIATQKNIWVIIPHQISREGRAKAEKKADPYYTMSDLQESSGVEQNCTVMVWIYQDAKFSNRGRVKIGVGKNRMGKKDILGWEIGADWEHCRFYEDGLMKVDEFEYEKKENYWDR
jgi:replicative DNA helicase